LTKKHYILKSLNYNILGRETMDYRFRNQEGFEEYLHLFNTLKSQKTTCEHIQDTLWEQVIGIGFFTDGVSNNDILGGERIRYRVEKLHYILTPIEIEIANQAQEYITGTVRPISFFLGKKYVNVENEYKIYNENIREGFFNWGKVKDIKQRREDSEIKISIYEKPRLEIEPIDITQEVYPLFQKDYEKLKTM
jgi:hypothetical protein